MKLKIKNFQAIKEAELVFDKGITVITGKTNSGKSSIFRALRTLVANRFISGSINYDADFLEITLEDNNNKVKYNRKNSTTYEINDTIYEKVGRTQLDEVSEVLNMPEVEVAGEKIRLNFWKQMSYPFLVGKTPNQLFNFIAQSKEHELIVAKQESDKEELKTTEKQLNSILSVIDSKKQDLINLQNEVKDLEKYSKLDYNTLNGFYQLTKTLDTILTNKKESSEKLNDSITKYNNLKQDLETKKSKLKDIKDYLDLYTILDTTITKLNTLKETKKDLESKVSTKDLESIKTKQNTIKKDLELLSNIEILINSKNTLNDKLGTFKEQLENKERTINTYKEELKEFKVCPLCGQALIEGEH